MRTNAEKIVQVVRDLPYGKVTTYGGISQEVYKHRRGAQAVGQVIGRKAKCDPDGFPWWRVCFNGLRPVNTDARKRLEREEVRFLPNGTVDSGYVARL